jgi:hypothetical protein
MISRFLKFFLIVALTGVALAASSLEESSRELAKEIAPSLAGKTVAVLDFLDQKKQVRELGRVIADQYLRVDLSRMGVKMVTRSALDKALAEIKLSQAGLTEAVSSGGLGSKFKAADVIVTGSLSQIGDTYTAATEAIDVKTGASLGLSRATFPKTSSYQALWDSVIEVPVGASSNTRSVSNSTSETTVPQSSESRTVNPSSGTLSSDQTVQASNFNISVSIEFRELSISGKPFDQVHFLVKLYNSSKSNQPLELDKNNFEIFDKEDTLYSAKIGCNVDFVADEFFSEYRSQYRLRPGGVLMACFTVGRNIFDTAQSVFSLRISESKYLNTKQAWTREIGK